MQCESINEEKQNKLSATIMSDESDQSFMSEDNDVGYVQESESEDEDFMNDAMDSDRQDAMEAGCDDYATKPIDFPGLLAKIEALTSR